MFVCYVDVVALHDGVGGIVSSSLNDVLLAARLSPQRDEDEA